MVWKRNRVFLGQHLSVALGILLCWLVFAPGCCTVRVVYAPPGAKHVFRADDTPLRARATAARDLRRRRLPSRFWSDMANTYRSTDARCWMSVAVLFSDYVHKNETLHDVSKILGGAKWLHNGMLFWTPGNIPWNPGCPILGGMGIQFNAVTTVGPRLSCLLVFTLSKYPHGGNPLFTPLRVRLQQVLPIIRALQGKPSSMSGARILALAIYAPDRGGRTLFRNEFRRLRADGPSVGYGGPAQQP